VEGGGPGDAAQKGFAHVGSRDGKKNSHRDGGGDGCFVLFFLLSAIMYTSYISRETHRVRERKRERLGCDHTHLYTRPGVTNTCLGSDPEHVCLCRRRTGTRRIKGRKT
jgi:hypothetical protein